MRVKISYECSWCGDVFETEQSAIAHECAMHLRISVAERAEWKRLLDAAKSAGIRAGTCRNPDTRAAFDTACRLLCDFETARAVPPDAAMKAWPGY